VGTAAHEIAQDAANFQVGVVAGKQCMGQKIHDAASVLVIMAGMTDSILEQAPERFPDASCSFPLAGPAGKLEVGTDVPQETPARRGTAVICHPHPLHGGIMHNKVVTMIERALRESGLATVRFNFRGVGKSEGAFDEGRGEGDDLAAVVEWVRAARPD